jgi:tetratricopeptide (TPR) repeat protein
MKNYKTPLPLALILIALLVAGCKDKPAETIKPKREYAGSSSCRECHEKFYKLWQPSHHGKALQPWSAELAGLIPAQAEPIEVEGKSYQAHITPERGWVSEDGDQEYDIIYTLGGKNYYNLLTLLDDGRLQVLPIFYDVRNQKWDNTTMSMLRHFEDGRTDAPLGWRDSMLTFNAACFSCHVSQIESNYDPETDTYATTWKEAGISCESCHGPSSEHIRVCKEAPAGTVPENLELIGWWDMNREERDSACAGCHTKGGPISKGYETGDRYWDHYDLTTFENLDYYPDGRDFGENYTMGSWLLSPCVQNSELACTHCHTSSGRYKQKADPNASCLPCHQKRVENITAHSRHKPGKGADTCVACHMPMNPFGGMNQSDHSMRPPMPNLSIAVGSRNACTMCHKDKDNEWALEQVTKWHPDFEKDTAPELERALLVKAMTDGDWEKLPAVLVYIADPASEPLFITTLIRQLPPSNDPGQHAILRKLVTGAKHPLVRSAAASALNADNNAADRPALLQALSDEYRLVRIRAADRLIALPETDIPEENRAAFDAASKEMWEATNLRLDHWGSPFNAANILMRQNRTAEAAAKYDRAHQLRNDIPQPLINSAMAYAQLGDLNAAEERLIKATKLPEPSDAALFNLGLLYAEQGRTEEAKKALYDSLEITPDNGQAACNLAILIGSQNYNETFRLLNHAISVDPYNTRPVETLVYYYTQTRQNALAKKVLEDAFQRGLSTPSLTRMYQQLR